MREYRIICIDDDERFLGSMEQAVPGRVASLCPQFKCVFEFVASPEELFQVIVSGGFASHGGDCSVTGSEESAKSGAAAGMSNAAGASSLAMVISDQMMPGVCGIDLIEKIKGQFPGVVCVLLTGHAGLESAKYAINQRLLDQYVSKPIEDIDAFALLVANLLKQHHLTLEEQERTAQLASTVEALRVSNEKIRAMHAAAEQVAMLFKGLKTLDFDELVEMIVREAPKIIEGDRRVLCFPLGEGGPALQDPLVTKNNCLRPEASLLRSVAEASTNSVQLSSVPAECGSAASEGSGSRLLIPLTVRGLPQQGYVCLCHLKGHHRNGQRSNVEGMEGSRDDRRGTIAESPAEFQSSIQPSTLDPRPSTLLQGASAEQIGESSEILLYKGKLLQEVLSVNLANAKLYQETRRESETDPLTGTKTRRVLDKSLQEEADRAARYGGKFCLAILDIDHFKGINDTFGHVAGDRVLGQLAAVIRREIRTTDLAVRYGGDEFAVLMPETSLQDATVVLERMRGQIEKIALETGTVTISGGVAEWDRTLDCSVSGLLRRADAALYQAKSAGRNRVLRVA